MFKLGSFESEILESMEKKLIERQAEYNYGFSKINKAAQLLTEARNIFKEAGLESDANDINFIIKSLKDSK